MKTLILIHVSRAKTQRCIVKVCWMASYEVQKYQILRIVQLFLSIGTDFATKFQHNVSHWFGNRNQLYGRLLVLVHQLIQESNNPTRRHMLSWYSQPEVRREFDHIWNAPFSPCLPFLPPLSMKIIGYKTSVKSHNSPPFSPCTASQVQFTQ